MKILVLLKTWPGGVGVAVKNYVREFEKQGHEVKTISRKEDMGIYSLAKSIFPIRNKVKELMKKNNYDIIYTKDWSLAFPLIFPYPLFKKKHYCGFGGLQNGTISKVLQKIVGRILGKRLICYGDPVKKKFPNANKIFNGINISSFKPLKGEKRIKNSVGFANAPKDIYNFDKVKKAVEKSGKKFFHVWGKDPKTMPGFYNKIETFISIPPTYTGFNLCWLEAMACGVPKIIGSNSGIGNRLPIDKIENFKSIEEAILNSKRKNYRKLISKEFSWEVMAKKTINLWKKQEKNLSEKIV